VNDTGVEHPFALNVDAEERLAGHDLAGVNVFLSFTDDLKVLRVFQFYFLRHG